MITNKVWRLRCLGVACLVAEDADDIRIALARKDAALLAYVCMHPGAPSARVAALLWPDAAASGAMNNLRQRLHRLRKATGARLLEVADIAHPAQDLRIDPAPALATLQADPNAWDGDLLQGVELDGSTELAGWLAAERKAWAERRRDALASIASTCEESGELARALVLAQRLLADDLLSEHAHRRLMRLHYLRGDIAAAVAAFEACERVLKDELGLKPSAETQQLLQTVEHGRPPAPVPGASMPLPARLLRPPRAVGRERERALLAEAQRDGQVAVLVGEAGIGKTRLLQDFAASHAQASVVYAQARPGDAAVPYGALARLLRALVAAVPSALESAPRGELLRVVPEFGDTAAAARAGQALRLQAAIERLLAAAVVQREGLSLAVDDLHFADRASVEMLRALVDAEALAALPWAFAHRPAAAADEDAALLQSLADSPRARFIELAPLAEADLAELLTSLALPGVDAASLAPALARHAGGNPLYALETLRAAAQTRPAWAAGAVPALPRPQTIAHLIDRRLLRLSKPALALARVAAIAAPDFSIELASQALATPVLALADAWQELEAADILHGEVFAHDLVHDAVLRATPAAVAWHAHKLVAQFLQERAAEPARIAAHWWAAGADDLAGPAFLEGAARARRIGRPREQVQLLLRAAQAFERGGRDPDAFSAKLAAVEPLLASAGPDRALLFSQELVEQAGHGEQEALAEAKQALVYLWAGRAADAEQAARHALAVARPDDDVARLEASLHTAQACGLQGRAGEGLALLRPWEEHLEGDGDPEQAALSAGFCSAYANLLIQDDRQAESVAWIRKFLAFAERAGDVQSQMTATMDLAAYSLRRGDLEAGVEHALRAEALNPGDEQAQELARWNRNGLGYMLCGLGRYGEGLAILETELAASEGRTGALRALQEQWLADVLIVLGQPARAHRLLDTEAPPGMRPHRRLIVRAALARASGQDNTALLEQACEAADRPSTRFDWLHASILLAARGGAAAQRLAELGAMARERGYFPLLVLAEHERLVVSTRQGRAAQGCVDAAVALEALARQHRYPSLYLPEILHTCATVWRSAGRLEDARRCMTEAMHWVHSVALPNIPSHLHDGFLQRNRANLSLRADFTRLLAATGA